ncbi:putative damage-inducible protein DinB [Paenibacillus cellulosilyticus]|uniref:Putative damage-inducible protein DinB n=1 Tax=Paenibacillus cellulosilyticus TaxID=375489 RepID=A0A2V2YV87_9BACL|nr:DinB family protein [Paenibacillus cellulosilyticus]PWW05142.1 putative damage-inducible protein DinB [Paenibacillus cellulosilyticus]QKS48686.1 DinB family protein [Paenibacillus cellulosilyticus]
MKTIKRMFEHQMWADRRLVDAVRQSGGGSQELLRLFRHVEIAEQVWITRLNGRSTAHLQLWADDADLDSIEALLASNEQQYRTYLAELTEEQLDADLTYANQSGVEFRTPIRDILTHVALHGQYHRGQINRMLREAGGEPRPLDYIVFAREWDL